MKNKNKLNIPFFDLRVRDQSLREDLTDAFKKVLDHGKLFMGPEVYQFEEKIAQEIDKRYGVSVGSGSSALYLALKASGVGPGDEVITTPLTWIITVNAIAACGAIPVFADVGDDFNIDPDSIKNNITSKTRAIVPMHYAGHMCNMDRICEISEKNNIMIIEDVAQAYGASLNGRKAGNFSFAAGFSMNPMKVLGGYGEAGMVTTDDKDTYERIKRLRHAGTTSDVKKRHITNDCLEVSLNHKMDTINAALLLVACKHFPEKQKRREYIAKKYDNELSEAIIRQGYHLNEVHGRYVYAVAVDERDELKSYLEKNLIETKIFNSPLACDAPVYQQYNSDSVPVARKMLSKNLILPSHEMLSDEQIECLIYTLNRYYN